MSVSNGVFCIGFYVLILFLCDASLSNDIVVNSSRESGWSSVLFVIPIDVPHNFLWNTCRLNSVYYCLHAFMTENNQSDWAYERRPGNELRLSDPTIKMLRYLQAFANAECLKIFEPFRTKHNLFVFRDGCCIAHYCHYFTFGFTEALLTPKEYYNRITDYSENGKVLNYIMAYYSHRCEMNIIMELGFGVGELKRVNHFGGNELQREGVPYLLKVGYHWTPEVPYDNPGDFITFGWFKKKVICADRPWICGKMKLRFIRKPRLWWRKHFGAQPHFSNNLEF